MVGTLLLLLQSVLHLIVLVQMLVVVDLVDFDIHLDLVLPLSLVPLQLALVEILVLIS